MNGGVHFLQRLDVTLQRGKLGGAVGQHIADHPAHHVFLQPHVVRTVRVGNLGLQHPELREVAPRLRFLRPEGGAEIVHFAVGNAGCLEVELPGLGEVGVSHVKVGDGEQRARALPDGTSKDRGVDEEKAPLVEEGAERCDCLVADAHDGGRPARSQPQVPVLQEEIDPVLLLGDRVVIRRVLNHLDAGDGELESRRRALVPARLAPDLERGFHFQPRDPCKTICAAPRFLGDSLDPSRFRREAGETRSFPWT